ARRQEVGRRPVRGAPHELGPAALLGALLRPDDGVAVEHDRTEPGSRPHHALGRDGRRPRTVGRPAPDPTRGARAAAAPTAAPRARPRWASATTRRAPCAGPYPRRPGRQRTHGGSAIVHDPPVTCASCGTTNAPGASTCAGCGRPLGAEAAASEPPPPDGGPT